MRLSFLARTRKRPRPFRCQRCLYCNLLRSAAACQRWSVAVVSRSDLYRSAFLSSCETHRIYKMGMNLAMESTRIPPAKSDSVGFERGQVV